MDLCKQDIVEECLELLRQGRSREECLERYPDDAAELEPILSMAASVRTDLAADLPLAARTRIKDRILSEWDHQHQPRHWHLRIPSLFHNRSLFPRVAFAAASLLLVLVLGGLGTNTAAANTVPGDVLYPVKEFREGVQLWLARSPEDKVEMYTSLVKERVDEVKKMAAREQADLNAISDALARMEGHLIALNVVVEKNLVDRESRDVDPGFLEALRNSISEQGAAGGLLEKTLDEVPTEGRPEFSDALKAIQLAQERIDSALETVGNSGFNE